LCLTGSDGAVLVVFNAGSDREMTD